MIYRGRRAGVEIFVILLLSRVPRPSTRSDCCSSRRREIYLVTVCVRDAVSAHIQTTHVIHNTRVLSSRTLSSFPQTPWYS